MGVGKSTLYSSTHVLYVTTGDKKGAGTDGNVLFTLTDTEGNVCKEQLVDVYWRNDFEQGNTDDFAVQLPNLKKISEIHLHRDESEPEDLWYVEKVEIIYKPTNEKSIFPVHRWIGANQSLVLTEYDSVLPQNDKHPEQRARELEKKRADYQFADPGKTSRRLQSLPADESFSTDYQWDLNLMKLELKAKTTITGWITGELDSLADFEELYKFEALHEPEGMQEWKSDEAFGYRKLIGCNPKTIELCRSVPSHMQVTQEMLEPYLEGQKLEDLIEMKKLYMCDYRYMEDIECFEGRKVPGATCLMYVRKDSVLVPIAIQLHPKPAEDNPIFLPNDGYVWLVAKMWFNLADASHHQSITHLGFTHLLMETFVVCTHRQLSPSHPIFRVLAPHFLYLLAINNKAIAALLNEDGWVNKAMSIGVTGMYNIIERAWKKWNFKDNGSLKNDLKRRGVEDTEALPYYPYRDDGLLLWDAMEKYVTNVVKAYYDDETKIQGDTELQAWGKELRETGEFEGLPTSFGTAEELIEVVTSFMFIGSVEHAAANFSQYDQYGFPPSYPAMLLGEPPKSKAQLTEADVVNYLPGKAVILDTLIITRLLSNLGTNALADYEMLYTYQPKAVSALEQFKEDLKQVGETIDERNKSRQKPYAWLHPSVVPNAISI